MSLHQGPWAIPARVRAAMGVVFAVLAATATPALGQVTRGNALDRIDAAVARGEINRSAAARQKLYYLFERSRMDPAWNASLDPPARCGTLVLADIARNLDGLDSATRQLFARLTRTADDVIQTPAGVYLTPHFRIEYESSGPDAPPAEDTSPANGVPDFVERTGEACEHSWSVEIVALGYRAPAVPNGTQGRYVIQYQAQNSYGFTVVISGQVTKIVLNPNYEGFPTNDDPDGDVLGALRVTVAHELKHASQRMYSGWAEDSYLELDATWIEDLVYDEVNDLYNFIERAGSPFTAPYASLVSVGAASYEDCNWELYQTERFGNDLMRTFWERRAMVGEPPMNTYAANLLLYGTTLEEAFAEYVCWNFASGRHAGSGFGYQEAAAYPTTAPTFTFTRLPVEATAGSVPGMAANTALIENFDGSLSGVPEFTFSATPNPSLTFGVSVLLCDRTGAVTRVPMPLTGGAGSLLLSAHDWSDIAWAALVMGNTTDFPIYLAYTFTVRAVAPILITHDRLGDVAWSPTSTPIRAVVRSGTATLAPGSVSLAYRVDGGAPTTTAMTPTAVPDEFAASIPPQFVGSLIEYRITAESTTGDMARAPALLGSWYRSEVASVMESFESAGSWTEGDVGDDATAGIWERGGPVGGIASPFLDATLPPGTLCYLTAPAAGNVDGGKTTLLSPVYPFGGAPYVRCVARYRRWYSNQVGGLFDDIWRVEASNDGGASWTNVETVAEGENDWKLIEVDLLALLGQPSQIRFRFIAEDTSNPSLVEAGVDDFEIIAVLENPVSVEPAVIPGMRLGLAAPNPSAGGVRLSLWLSTASLVTATVRDPQGRMVRNVYAGGVALPAGATSLEWDGRNARGERARAGIYWIEVVVGNQRFERRVVLLR